MAHSGIQCAPKGHQCTGILESIQNRAVRWITRAKREDSIHSFRDELGLLPLAEIRKHQRLTLLFKVLHGELDVSPAEVDLIPTGRVARGCQGGNNLLLRELGGKDPASPLWNSTTARGIKDWNALPANIINADDAGIFSNRLSKLPGP